MLSETPIETFWPAFRSTTQLRAAEGEGESVGAFDSGGRSAARGVNYSREGGVGGGANDLLKDVGRVGVADSRDVVRSDRSASARAEAGSIQSATTIDLNFGLSPRSARELDLPSSSSSPREESGAAGGEGGC